MVLEFSVMVLLFFSAGLPHCFYIKNFSHFKGCCWLRSVFITTKKYIFYFNTSLIMNVAYLNVTCGLRFHLFIFYFLDTGLLMSFHGHSCPSDMIICIQPQTRGASGRGCGRSGMHGGARAPAPAPAPLRSDAKEPLRSALCDMNDIVDDKNQYRRSLHAEYAVCLGHQLAGGAPSQLLKNNKIKKTVRHHRDCPACDLIILSSYDARRDLRFGIHPQV